MQENELNNVYLYAFKEMTDDETESHLNMDTGSEVIECWNECEPTTGTIKAFLQNKGFKVFKVFKERPAISISPLLTEDFTFNAIHGIDNDSESSESNPSLLDYKHGVADPSA